MEVSAQIKDGGSATVQYAGLDAENLDALRSAFGDETVFDHAKRSFVVALQSFIRSQIDANKPPEEIQASVDDWKPGQKRASKSPAERIQELMAKLDPSARDAIIKEYRKKGGPTTQAAA